MWTSPPVCVSSASKLNDIPTLASNALKDACGVTNPRAADQRQIEEIFRSAF
jgi:alcohol dehydrogenase